jgi:hypothetical protein
MEDPLFTTPDSDRESEGSLSSTSDEEIHQQEQQEQEETPEPHPEIPQTPFGDYKAFMGQSSAEYLMTSTLDLFKTMRLARELRDLFTCLSDWDRIVIFYAYELMQRNMQICYKLGLYLYQMRNEDVIPQMIYWGLLLFCMSNVQTAYTYLIYRIYILDKELARKIHETLKEQFMFFDNPEEMMGEFNLNTERCERLQGLARRQGVVNSVGSRREHRVAAQVVNQAPAEAEVTEAMGRFRRYYGTDHT